MEKPIIGYNIYLKYKSEFHNAFDALIFYWFVQVYVVTLK